MTMKLPRISVIIPALNEAASIGLVIRDIPPGLVSEIIVVDNGSTDGTAEIARQAGARIVHEPIAVMALPALQALPQPTAPIS